ncbi:MAG TPA: butyrate kinase [Bacillota bacterium]|nr:butyrate kinase [Bacillota bacterium]
MPFNMLIINPGSTSTKIAYFKDEEAVFTEILRHSAEELKPYPTIVSQKDFRKGIILRFLKEKQLDVKSLDAVVGRGGLVKSIPGGTYIVNDALLRDLEIGINGQHASNLGGILASEIASEAGCPAYILDPVVVDETLEMTKITGIPEIVRVPISHPLNQKAVARRYAKEHGRKYEDLDVIVAHMGGGISVGAHHKGQIIDVNNALSGEGPIAPERAGTIPAAALAELCFSGKYSLQEIKSLIYGKGGIYALLGTTDIRELVSRAETDEKAAMVLDAFCYQIARAIGGYAVILKGKAEAILLTGGIAYSEYVTSKIREYVSWIAPVFVYPGEDEMLALAQGGLRCLRGEEAAKTYV